MKTEKNNLVLIEFRKRLFAFRSARFARLTAAGKAAQRSEYILMMREYFQKLHDLKKTDEAWLLLKFLAAKEQDFRCIKIRHSKYITAGIPDLGANAMWASMMISTVDFALLKVFSDLAFGREVSRPAAMLNAGG